MKRIIIMGATSGLGREVARLCIERGWQVGLAGRRIEALEALQALAPDRIFVERIDVTTEEASEALLCLVERMGGMDIYLHASGIGWSNLSLDAAYEVATLRTNGEGFVRMVTTAFNYFASHGGGDLAVISSIAGTKALGAAPAYSATKRMQRHYLEALAQQTHIRHLPIHLIDIRPGFVATPLLGEQPRYPMLMQTERVARAILRAIDRRRRHVVIDWRYALLVRFWRLIPEWLWERLPVK